MKYSIKLKLKVDPEANFLESDPKYGADSVETLLRDLLYDVDDVEVMTVVAKEIG